MKPWRDMRVIIVLSGFFLFFCGSETCDQTDFINGYGIKFKLIPAGEFYMGGGLDNEKPIHRVEITRSFYMGIHEVTQGQYFSVMDRESAYSTDSDFPASVTWNEAVAFCDKLSYLTGEKYRLPTEAEWEYAARGGLDQKKFVWGDSSTPEVDGKKHANIPDETLKKNYPGYKILNGYTDGYADLAPIGSFEPNGFGLYDMAGNAWERCQDWYQESYYAESPVQDPQGPATGNRRVLRGGGYAFGHSERMRVSYRCGSPLDQAGSNDGFRIVLEVKKE